MNMRATAENNLGKSLMKMFGGGLAIAVLLACSATSVNADNSLSCYKGDKDAMIYVGEIGEADFQDAANECNSFFGDCNGECIGCYLDENLSGEICLDNQGRKFTR